MDRQSWWVDAVVLCGFAIYLVGILLQICSFGICGDYSFSFAGFRWFIIFPNNIMNDEKRREHRRVQKFTNRQNYHTVS